MADKTSEELIEEIKFLQKRERTMEAGCNGYIEKPINPDTFKSQIENYLKARPAGGGT